MAEFKQEMPPPGGFGRVEWTRRVSKTINGYAALGGLVAFSGVGWAYWYYTSYRNVHMKNELEMRDARLAVHPLFLAENHRALLKRLRVNRDEEKELMKDVPDWKVGTYYGKPVYYNLYDRFPLISVEELYAHSDKRPLVKKMSGFSRQP